MLYAVGKENLHLLWRRWAIRGGEVLEKHSFVCRDFFLAPGDRGGSDNLLANELQTKGLLSHNLNNRKNRNHRREICWRMVLFAKKYFNSRLIDFKSIETKK